MARQPRSFTRRAAANQQARDAANKAHALENELRLRIRNLEHELDLMRGHYNALVPIANEYQAICEAAATRLSDAELVALAAAVHTEGVTQTPARQRLVAELQVRGILPTKSDSETPERVAQLYDLATGKQS